MKISQNKLIYLFATLFNISSTQAAPMNNDDKQSVYKEECTSCHMAYPARLLPARSWQKIMNTLDDHFGDNASLDPTTIKTITQYLQDNSADSRHSQHTNKILRYLPQNSTPLRISELPYIRHKHDEIPSRYIKANPRVKSMSNCVACHKAAERGLFDDDNVRIPGYGRWED